MSEELTPTKVATIAISEIKDFDTLIALRNMIDEKIKGLVPFLFEKNPLDGVNPIFIDTMPPITPTKPGELTRYTLKLGRKVKFTDTKKGKVIIGTAIRYGANRATVIPDYDNTVKWHVPYKMLQYV